MISPNVCPQKVATAFSKITQKYVTHLGHFCEYICHHELSKLVNLVTLAHCSLREALKCLDRHCGSLWLVSPFGRMSLT